MNRSLKRVGSLTKKTFFKWLGDNVGIKAAGLSYYTLIAMVPLTILMFLLTGVLFVNESEVKGELYKQVEDLFGERAGASFRILIDNVKQPGSDVWTITFGAITLIFGASHVFAQLQNSINDIWSVREQRTFTLFGALRNRIVSVLLVAVSGILLLLLLISSAWMVAFRRTLAETLDGFQVYFIEVLNFILPFALITGLFILLYKFMPRSKVDFRDVWIGAIVGSGLFSIGRWLVGWYLGSGTYGSAYGIAGSVIVILIWLYFSAQTLLFGAVLTNVYAEDYGSAKQ